MAKKTRKHSDALTKGDIRNRVVKTITLRADALRDHPMNWRTHDKHQKGALEGSLRELGWAANVYVRIVGEGERFVQEGKLKVGDVCTLDGHCRRSVLPPDFELTATVLDLTEDEGIKFLAVFDPISALAGQDDHKLAEVLSNMDTLSPDLSEMLSKLYKLPDEPSDGDKPEDVNAPAGETKYCILVTCADEASQTEMLDRLMLEGVTCKSMIG